MLVRPDLWHQHASCRPRRLRSARGRPRRKAGPAGRLCPNRRTHSAGSDALALRVPTRFSDAHLTRNCGPHDAFFRRADVRIGCTQCALMQRETRITTLIFFV